MSQFNITCVIGTRPEALKMAPLIETLSANPLFNVHTILTAQHRTLLDQMLKEFSIRPNIDFDIMMPNQDLADVNAKLLLKFHEYYTKEKPQLVIAQGDTTTTLVSALAAFYKKIPFAHVEAGLRTSDIYTPFPEEMNRRLASQVTTLHFAPTELAKMNLAKEGIEKNVFVVGNTIIDTLYHFAHRIETKNNTDKKLILATCHRRENFGEPLSNICQALKMIASRGDVEIIFPVHPNPNVQKVVYDTLENIENIQLIQPLDYPDLVKNLKASYLVLTDSGGLQEEAPALGKPVLVMRSETERPEGILCGANKVVGTNCEKIVNEVSLLLDDFAAYQKMVVSVSPFGDGKASKRINKYIEQYLTSPVENIAMALSD